VWKEELGNSTTARFSKVRRFARRITTLGIKYRTASSKSQRA
jgi:hypothetical protein